MITTVAPHAHPSRNYFGALEFLSTPPFRPGTMLLAMCMLVPSVVAWSQDNSTSTSNSSASGLVVPQFNTSLGLLQQVSSTFVSGSGSTSTASGSSFGVTIPPGASSFSAFSLGSHGHTYTPNLGTILGSTLGSLNQGTNSTAASISPSFGTKNPSSSLYQVFSIGSHSHLVSSAGKVFGFNTDAQLAAIASANHNAVGYSTSQSVGGTQTYRVTSGGFAQDFNHNHSHSYSFTYSTSTTYTYVPTSSVLVNSVALHHSGQIAGTNFTDHETVTVDLKGHQLSINGSISASGNTQTVIFGGTSESQLLSGNGFFDVGGTTNASINTALAGTNGLTKVGSGTLELIGSQNNTFSGQTNVSAGTLVLGKTGGATAIYGNLQTTGGHVSFSASHQIANSANLTVNSGSIQLNGFSEQVNSITIGPGGELNLGGGALTTTSTINNQGLVTATSGSLNASSGLLNSGSVLQGSSSNISSSSLNNFGQFNQNGSLAVANFGAITNQSSGSVLSHGTLATTGSFSNAGDVNIHKILNVSGTYSNSGNASTSIHSGAVMSTGTTNVTGGSFENNGQVNGGVNVHGNGSVKGTGHFGSLIRVGSGGTLAPGNSVGLMTGTNVEFGDDGRFQFEITSALGEMGSDWDGLQISGALDITATSGNPFELTLSSMGILVNGFDPTSDYEWTFLTAAGGIENFSEDKFSINSTNFLNDLAGGSFGVKQNGNSLVLGFSAVPEPSALLLVGSCLAASGLRRLRRPQVQFQR